LAKSKSDPIGDVASIGGLTSILGCRVCSLPLKYLDLPLGASFKAKSIRDDVIEKMMYLSKGGRLNLMMYLSSNSH
jgi:hypothetical protein